MQVVQTADEKITGAEVRAVVALWAQGNALRGCETDSSTLADVAEALGVQESEAQRLVEQVRCRERGVRRVRVRRLGAMLAASCVFLTAGVGAAVKARVDQQRSREEAQYAAFLASPAHLRQVAKWAEWKAKWQHEMRWREYRGRYFAGNDGALTDVQMLRSGGRDSLAYKARLERARRSFEAGIVAEKALAHETGTGQDDE